MTIWHALAVCVAAAITDVMWCNWTLSANKHNAVAAASWGVGIFLFGAVSVDAYVHNLLYLIPAGFGAWFGTWFTVRREGRKVVK